MATKKSVSKSKPAAKKAVKKSSAAKAPSKSPATKSAVKKSVPVKKTPAKKTISKPVKATKTPAKPAAKSKPVSKPAAKPSTVKSQPASKAVKPATVKQVPVKKNITPAPAKKATEQIIKPAGNGKSVPVVGKTKFSEPINPKSTVSNMTMNKVQSNTPEKSRYSDTELQEFRELIINKLDDARTELVNLQAQIINANENGTDDTGATFKMLEDGSDTLAKEEAAQLAARQKKFIEQLEAALVRIENKTYGICRVTGKLIPKERLRAVPHTTQSMEAKLKQYKD